MVPLPDIKPEAIAIKRGAAKRRGPLARHDTKRRCLACYREAGSKMAGLNVIRVREISDQQNTGSGFFSTAYLFTRVEVYRCFSSTKINVNISQQLFVLCGGDLVYC